jgi:hypothetical protein
MTRFSFTNYTEFVNLEFTSCTEILNWEFQFLRSFWTKNFNFYEVCDLKRRHFSSPKNSVVKKILCELGSHKIFFEMGLHKKFFCELRSHKKKPFFQSARINAARMLVHIWEACPGFIKNLFDIYNYTKFYIYDFCIYFYSTFRLLLRHRQNDDKHVESKKNEFSTLWVTYVIYYIISISS